MNNRKISAETAAKMSVSSLVSGCRKVSLKVACAKITAKRKKVQMESATMAGVRFRFFCGRVEGVNGNMNGPTICRSRIMNARLREPTPRSGRWLHYICGPLGGGWRLGLPGGRGWHGPAVAPYQPDNQRHDQDQRQQRNKEYCHQNECARLHADIALHHRAGMPR